MHVPLSFLLHLSFPLPLSLLKTFHPPHSPPLSLLLYIPPVHLHVLLEQLPTRSTRRRSLFLYPCIHLVELVDRPLHPMLVHLLEELHWGCRFLRLLGLSIGWES